MSLYSFLRLDLIMSQSRLCTWSAGKINPKASRGHVVLTVSYSWSQNFDKETDWNVISTEGSGINNRQVKLSRGKFLGGSSGCNGTLCIRGSKHDYDDWGVPGWSGEEFFKYMSKVSRQRFPYFTHFIQSC